MERKRWKEKEREIDRDGVRRIDQRKEKVKKRGKRRLRKEEREG